MSQHYFRIEYAWWMIVENHVFSVAVVLSEEIGAVGKCVKKTARTRAARQGGPLRQRW